MNFQTPRPIDSIGDRLFQSHIAGRDNNKKIVGLKKKETGLCIHLLERIKIQFKGNPLRQVSAFFDEYQFTAATGRKRIASFETQKRYRENMNVFVRKLREMNMPIQNIDEISARQVRRVFEQFEKEGKTAGFMAAINTTVRRFGIWVGKPDMCPTLPKLLVNPSLARRQYSALVAKDWETVGVDTEMAILRVEASCAISALQLRLAKSFGVRVQEFLMFKPRLSTKIPGHLDIRDGTKGGRRRTIPIETDEQRMLLERALAIGDKHPKGLVMAKDWRTLAQAKNHIKYQLKKAGITKEQLGVTAHGLRHGYACHIYKALTGEAAPVMGGGLVDPELDKTARREIAERLGHGRVEICSAYLGTHHGLSQMKRKNLERLKALLDQDTILIEIAKAAGINTFCVAGPAADGNPVSRGQIMTFGFTATCREDETSTQADRRVLADATDMAARAGQILGVNAVAASRTMLATDVSTYEFFGVTCPRKRSTHE